MKRKSLQELKKHLEETLLYLNDLIDSWEGIQNPQVVDMRKDLVSRRTAIEDVLLYINNGTTYQFEKKEGR